MGIMDLLNFGGAADPGAGQDPNSQLALMAHDQPAQPAPSPDWTSAIGNPMNGDKLFGEDRSQDNVVDPDTGVPKGFTRRENNKAMLQASLMMMAAGMSTDEGARASLLSNIPGIMDTSTKERNFAQMRLEMAKARVATAQANAQQQQEAAWQKFVTGGVTPGVGVPVSAGQPAGPPPGPMAPVVGAGGQAGQAAQNVAGGGGNAADQAILRAASDPGTSPLMGSGDPTAPQTPEDMQIIKAGGNTPVPTASPMPDSAYNPLPMPVAGPTPSAPAPAGPAPGPTSVLTNPIYPQKAGPAPVIPPLTIDQLDPTQRAMLAAMPSKEGRAEFERLANARQQQEVVGSPIMLPGTNEISVPVFQNGQLKAYQKVGAGTTHAAIQTDDKNNKTIVTTDASGNPTGITPYTPESQRIDAETQKVDLDNAKKTSDDLKGEFKQLQNSSQDYQRMKQAVDDVNSGKVMTGPVQDMVAQYKRIKGAIGGMTDDDKRAILATDNANTLTSELQAKFARSLSSRVDNMDLAVAKAAITGGGTPMEVAQAIKNQMVVLDNQVKDYNDRAGDHNDRVKSIKGGGDYTRAGLPVKTIQGGFGVTNDQYTPAYAQNTPHANEGDTLARAAAQPAPTPLQMLRGNQNGAPAAAAAPVYTAAQIAAARAELAKRQGQR